MEYLVPFCSGKRVEYDLVWAELKSEMIFYIFQII